MKLPTASTVGILSLLAATHAVHFPIAPRLINRFHSSRRKEAHASSNNSYLSIRAGEAEPIQVSGGAATEVAPIDQVNLSISSSSTNSDNDEDDHLSIAKKLKNRNSTNLSRKFTHALFGIFFACLNQFLPRSTFVPSMGLLTSATLLMELLRYNKGFGWMNKALHFFLGTALRKHEMEGKFTGSFYYFAGVYITARLYPKTAATMGILQLALADPSASYFGKKTRHVYWSRIEGGLGGFGRNKGILGFLGGALFCFPFNYRVLRIARWDRLAAVSGVNKGVIPGGEAALVAVSLLLGLAGAFADLAVPTPALTMPKKVLGMPVPPFHVDDNFVVPVVAGFACTKIFELFGWDNGLELASHIVF
jgi:dolichol kinase